MFKQWRCAMITTQKQDGPLTQNLVWISRLMMLLPHVPVSDEIVYHSHEPFLEEQGRPQAGLKNGLGRYRKLTGLHFFCEVGVGWDVGSHMCAGAPLV